jgi:tetratricopeptide (TPR) repeat protein
MYNENCTRTASAAYFFAQLFLKSAYYMRALGFIDSAITSNPTDPELPLLKARIHEIKREEDEAISAYDEALRIDSLNFNALFGRAKILKFDKHDERGAIKDFLKFVNNYPGEECFYIEIADSYLRLGDTVNALKCISNSYFAKIEDTPYLNLRASLLVSMGKYYEAIFDYNSAISKDPSGKSFYFDRGIAYSKLEMPDKAAGDFQKCISLDARDALSYSNLAYCLFDMHDYELAELSFEKAIRLDPKQFDSYVGLSITSLVQNKKKKCLVAMSEALKLKKALNKGMKGIAEITKDGYFWQFNEMKSIKEVFVLMNMEEPEARDLSDDDPGNATGRQIQIRK